MNGRCDRRLFSRSVKEGVLMGESEMRAGIRNALQSLNEDTEQSHPP